MSLQQILFLFSVSGVPVSIPPGGRDTSSHQRLQVLAAGKPRSLRECIVTSTHMSYRRLCNDSVFETVAALPQYRV